MVWPAHELSTRALSERDIVDASALLDDALGAGFWDLDLAACGSHRAAFLGDEIVGVASAALVESLSELPDLEPPIALVRIVAVAPHARGAGVASRLLGEVLSECAAGGASSAAAYAWVHGPGGKAQLAGVLERSGFARQVRLEGFYASPGTPACPACGESPCVCPADLYARNGNAVGE